MKIYKANKKGNMRYIIVITLLLPIVIFYLNRDFVTRAPYGLLPLLAPIVFSIWTYLNTSYKITGNKLTYTSGAMKGEVPITNIKKIYKSKAKWNTFGPALAKDGITIEYNTYNKVFLAPLDLDLLITDLLKVNPQIELQA